MRLWTGLALGFALLGPAHAATGRTTNRTYKTMDAAAKATAAFLFNRAGLTKKVWHASDITLAKSPHGQPGRVQVLFGELPKTPFNYSAGSVEVKVLKVKGGWKGYTDTAAKPVLWK